MTLLYFSLLRRVRPRGKRRRDRRRRHRQRRRRQRCNTLPTSLCLIRRRLARPSDVLHLGLVEIIGQCGWCCGPLARNAPSPRFFLCCCVEFRYRERHRLRLRSSCLVTASLHVNRYLVLKAFAAHQNKRDLNDFPNTPRTTGHRLCIAGHSPTPVYFETPSTEPRVCRGVPDRAEDAIRNSNIFCSPYRFSIHTSPRPPNLHHVSHTFFAPPPPSEQSIRLPTRQDENRLPSSAAGKAQRGSAKIREKTRADTKRRRVVVDPVTGKRKRLVAVKRRKRRSGDHRGVNGVRRALGAIN